MSGLGRRKISMIVPDPVGLVSAGLVSESDCFVFLTRVTNY